MNFRFLLLFFCTLSVGAFSKDAMHFRQSKSFVSIPVKDGELTLTPLTDRCVRVHFRKDLCDTFPEIVLTGKHAVPPFNVFERNGCLELRLSQLVVKVQKTGNLSFEEPNGRVLLNEQEGGRLFKPVKVGNEPAFQVEQRFVSPENEILYGLGQFQDGHFNLRGIARTLRQVNTQIALPFLYSSKGYGLLWHQYGITDFNPADSLIRLEKSQQSGAQGQMADVTTTAGTVRVAQDQSRYQGMFQVQEEGDYSFSLELGDMGNRHFLAVDGRAVVDQSNMWLPPSVGVVVHLTKGLHILDVLCKSSNQPMLTWRKVDNSTTFRSPAAKELDYVFFAGNAENVIATYRKLSGEAPLLPVWAYGFWQCRERYSSSAQLIQTAQEFRDKNIPVDAIVQDWQYWGKNGWGVPEFDSDNYPDPVGFIGRLHQLRTHLMVSIWSNPDKNSTIGKEFVSRNQFIPDTKWLDYYNPQTRQEYWNVLRKNMFEKGVDAWWMDAVEPENDALKGTTTFWGKGDFLRLTYPYFVSKAVYEGQRETSLEKRVCILTRSAYPGQQRFGVINWSGDVGGTWDSFRRQIASGLSYSLSGFPYWTTDIGGFFRPGRSQYTDEGYQELLIRWFQWGALNPVFRVHGYQSETEPWHYSAKTGDAIGKAIAFRYKLMPYIYSGAWKVTRSGSTLMRPLVMDFPDDSIAIRQPYEYMFGSSLLVAPILQPGLKHQNVYLPKGTLWYDFRSAESYKGGQTVQAPTPLDAMPVYVRAGSILPLVKGAPVVTSSQYDSLEIRIYEGADGSFTLYEDEGDSYRYEKGVSSTIRMNWNNQKKALLIEKRAGQFPGMYNVKVFALRLFYRDGNTNRRFPEGVKNVRYTGQKMEVFLNK